MSRVTVGRGAALAREPGADTASKLGPVATISTPAEQSCPHDCALWIRCYYRKGLHLGRVNRELESASAGATASDVARAEAAAIDGLRGDAPLRLHVGGDARTREAAEVVSAAAARYTERGGQPVFTFTHAWRRVERDRWRGVSVLASVESPAEARAAMRLGYAAAMTVERHPADGRAYKIGALRIIPCVEQTRGVRCTDCRLCFDDRALRRRRAVISFAMHGPSVRRRGWKMRSVVWRGVRYRSLGAAARAAGLSLDLVRARLVLRRWSVEDALGTPRLGRGERRRRT